mmetsp:Transcript_90142/g.232681  ORF Transcript_90142/g.232681 Transcript_90142/m.232681 type:complete len:131 (-) Transcript_90142:474-866(-)
MSPPSLSPSSSLSSQSSLQECSPWELELRRQRQRKAQHALRAGGGKPRLLAAAAGMLSKADGDGPFAAEADYGDSCALVTAAIRSWVQLGNGGAVVSEPSALYALGSPGRSRGDVQWADVGAGECAGLAC